MTKTIELRDNAKQQLMEIQSIEQAVDYINKVKSVETYLKATKQDDELLKLMQEQKIRSQRIAGQMLQQTDLNSGSKSQLSGKDVSGGHAYKPPEDDKPTLSDLGISKNESSTYQKIASIPEAVFEEEMEKAKQGDSTTDITTSRFKRLASQNELSQTISHEKNLKKYARLLGYKIQIENPDLLILYRKKSQIKFLENV